MVDRGRAFSWRFFLCNRIYRHTSLLYEGWRLYVGSRPRQRKNPARAKAPTRTAAIGGCQWLPLFGLLIRSSILQRPAKASSVSKEDNHQAGSGSMLGKLPTRKSDPKEVLRRNAKFYVDKYLHLRVASTCVEIYLTSPFRLPKSTTMIFCL